MLELFVGDLERTVSFYRDVVGMALSLDDAGPDGPRYEAWWPATADRDYLYFAFWEASAPDARTRLSVGLLSDDLEAVHRRTEAAGVEVTSPPADGPYGRRAEYVDPDGNRITVGQR